MNLKNKVLKKVRAPVRLDFAGGTTDIEPFASMHNGAVLNASINKYIIGELHADSKSVGLCYNGDIPTSSGLGTSGVMNVVWLALTSNEKNKIKLAENVYEMEQILGLTGGKQDQYAAVLGGINLLEFNNQKVKITRLKLNKKFIKELEKRLLILYTGKPHFSGKSNKAVIDDLISGKNKKYLLNLRDIAFKLKESFENSNFNEIEMLLNQETENRRKLHKLIIPKHVDKLIKTSLKNGATAVKICGSGNGGSLLLYCRDLDSRKKLIKKFNKKIIEFKFDFKGLVYL